MTTGVTLLIGTRKGAFIYRSDEERRCWQPSEPMLEGWRVFHIAADARCHPPRIYAAASNPWWGRALARSDDGGASWEPLTNGLPGPQDYRSVYREGLDTDGLEPEGAYVGTSNGQLFAGTSGGDRWQRLPGTLPPILSVTATAY
jgi:hypothetical protein